MTNRKQISGTGKWHSYGPMAIGYLALIVLVAGFGGWAVLTEIAGAIVASGKVEVEQQRQVVQHRDGGTVGEILVAEGDLVKAGDVLLRLDDTRVKSELAVIESQYYELIARRGRLEAERDGLDEITFDSQLTEVARTRPEILDLIDGQARLFEARLLSYQREAAQMGERKVQIAAQVDGLVAQYEAQELQLALIETELEDQKVLLAKGLAQASRVSALERQKVQIKGRMGEIIAAKAEAAGRAIETDIAIGRLLTSRREEAITRLRDIRYRELELAERRILLQDTLSRLDIRAPVSGTVFGLQVHALRSVIRPAEPVMYLVPKGQPLVIVSQVDPIDIDEVRVGQDVTLRFPAFARRTTPELFGKIVNLSADSFVDERTGAAYYRAEILPNPGEIERLGGAELLPGMPVESYIRTEDRTPLNYLVKPITDYFTKSFRES